MHQEWFLMADNFSLKHVFFLTLFDSEKNDSNLKYFPTKFQTIKILFEEAETTKKKITKQNKMWKYKNSP